jgi:hypothetical protein
MEIHFRCNNNNQAFYSQVSWGRVEMKPHEQKKNRYKTRVKKKGKINAIKNQIKKEKTIKREVKKVKKGQGKKLDKRQ